MYKKFVKILGNIFLAQTTFTRELCECIITPWFTAI